MIDLSDAESPSIFKTFDAQSKQYSGNRTQDVSMYSSLKDSEFKLMKRDIPKPKGRFLDLFKQSSIIQGHEVEFSPNQSNVDDGTEIIRKNPHTYRTKAATSIRQLSTKCMREKQPSIIILNKKRRKDKENISY